MELFNISANLNLNSNLDEFKVKRKYVHDEFFILGEGSFGLVTLGTLKKPNDMERMVALKGAQKTMYVNLLKAEAQIMAGLDHPHLVKLFAVQERPFKIIMEYMQHGDLLDALKQNLFFDTDLIEVLLQIVSGMEYLSEMGYVHRDLACRNVFVNRNRECKVGDFGLCKYVGNTGGVYKIEDTYNECCAPEARKNKKFTTKCDVWSFGVLVWELYISVANELPGFFKKAFLAMFLHTETLPKPTLCPDNLFSYAIQVLLTKDATQRPFFSQVKKDLCRFAKEMPCVKFN